MDSGPPPWEVLIATPFLCGMVCPCLSFVHVWYLIALFVLYQVLHRFPFWTWRTYVYVCVCTIPEALWVPGAMLYVPVLVRLSYKHKNNLSCGRKFGSEDSLRNHKATRSRLVHSWNHFNADTILSLLHSSVCPHTCTHYGPYRHLSPWSLIMLQFSQLGLGLALALMFLYCNWNRIFYNEHRLCSNWIE